MTGPHSTDDTVQLYLDLLKRVLIGDVQEDSDKVFGVNLFNRPGIQGRALTAATALFNKMGVEVAHKRPYDPETRESGLDWPARADSMIGLRRMNNLQHCVETVLRDQVPGDLIETGVWRGGATIFMRGILKAYGVTDRIVWAADSFKGLPKPDPHRYPADAGDIHHTHEALSIGVEQVKNNFRRYRLLDDQVRFLVGWFADTLPTAPLGALSVVRLDGDMYSSTMDAIEVLYPKLSPGGFCIVDDYALEGCRKAIDDYRSRHGIKEPIEMVDWTGAFWRKS